MAVFNCAKCSDFTKKKRRCQEDREDFTSDDDLSTFPIYITKGATLYSFCPAKATWDKNLLNLYNVLVISAETGALYNDGGISSQPDWFIELFSWFLPFYGDNKFYSRVKNILGEQPKDNKLVNAQSAKPRR